MKKIRFLMVCLAAVLTGLYVVSCGSDSDSEPSSDSSIVGTWVEVSSSSSDDEYVMLCPNGTGYEFEECSTHGVDVDKFEYIYNQETGKLTIIDDDGYTQIHEVIAVTANKLVVKHNSAYTSSTVTYNRTSSPYTQAQLEKLYQNRKSSSSYYSY